MGPKAVPRHPVGGGGDSMVADTPGSLAWREEAATWMARAAGDNNQGQGGQRQTTQGGNEGGSRKHGLTATTGGDGRTVTPAHGRSRCSDGRKQGAASTGK